MWARCLLITLGVLGHRGESQTFKAFYRLADYTPDHCLVEGCRTDLWLDHHQLNDCVPKWLSRPRCSIVISGVLSPFYDVDTRLLTMRSGQHCLQIPVGSDQFGMDPFSVQKGFVPLETFHGFIESITFPYQLPSAPAFARGLFRILLGNMQTDFSIYDFDTYPIAISTLSNFQTVMNHTFVQRDGVQEIPVIAPAKICVAGREKGPWLKTGTDLQITIIFPRLPILMTASTAITPSTPSSVPTQPSATVTTPSETPTSIPEPSSLLIAPTQSTSIPSSLTIDPMITTELPTLLTPPLITLPADRTDSPYIPPEWTDPTLLPTTVSTWPTLLPSPTDLPTLPSVSTDLPTIPTQPADRTDSPYIPPEWTDPTRISTTVLTSPTLLPNPTDIPTLPSVSTDLPTLPTIPTRPADRTELYTPPEWTDPTLLPTDPTLLPTTVSTWPTLLPNPTDIPTLPSVSTDLPTLPTIPTRPADRTELYTPPEWTDPTLLPTDPTLLPTTVSTWPTLLPNPTDIPTLPSVSTDLPTLPTIPTRPADRTDSPYIPPEWTDPTRISTTVLTSPTLIPNPTDLPTLPSVSTDLPTLPTIPTLSAARTDLPTTGGN